LPADAISFAHARKIRVTRRKARTTRLRLPVPADVVVPLLLRAAPRPLGVPRAHDVIRGERCVEQADASLLPGTEGYGGRSPQTGFWNVQTVRAANLAKVANAAKVPMPSILNESAAAPSSVIAAMVMISRAVRLTRVGRSAQLANPANRPGPASSIPAAACGRRAPSTEYAEPMTSAPKAWPSSPGTLLILLNVCGHPQCQQEGGSSSDAVLARPLSRRPSTTVAIVENGMGTTCGASLAGSTIRRHPRSRRRPAGRCPDARPTTHGSDAAAHVASQHPPCDKPADTAPAPASARP
jgi:hypothetical protein